MLKRFVIRIRSRRHAPRSRRFFSNQEQRAFDMERECLKAHLKVALQVATVAYGLR